MRTVPLDLKLVAEVIRHERDGLLVPCGDVALLAEAMLRLHQDPQLRRTCGDAGRHKVLTEYQWPPRLALVRETYERLARPSS